MRKKSGWLAVAAGLACLGLAGGAWAQGGKREITRIAGDLYRFQNSFHFSVFLVTPEGVIATDPINADAARWLEAEIGKRFDRTVAYVVYSHDHPDHISGGEVFADTATVVAHEKAAAKIASRGGYTAPPDVTFSDRMTISLGGKRVELHYVGPSHSDNMIVAVFPAERVLFVVDIANVRRLPFRDFPDAYFPGHIDALKKVESLDFDVIAPGHGPLGKKADITANRAYLESLHRAVRAGIDEGRSLADLKSRIDMAEYRDWSQYEAWLPLNIEGMYRILTR